MSNREEFEQLEDIKDILNDHKIFFNEKEDRYQAEKIIGDDSVYYPSWEITYMNGAWYAWQARVPEGYVAVPVEPSDYMKCTVRDYAPDIEDYENMSKWDWEKLCAEIYKAMIEAVEK